MDKVLVTGGTGYIGSHTVVELQNAGYEVIIVDNLSNSTIESVSRIESITGIKPHFENINCLDYVAMDRMFASYDDVKAVIHFAASKAVGESVKKPLQYYRNNVNGLLNILELMPIHGVKNIVFSSSCTVYGQPDKLPVTEDAPIKPATSPYGNTKQICEEIIRDVANSGSDFNSVVLRYFNPIGAHPSALIGELPVGVPNNLVPFITQTAIGMREKLMVYGDDYDTPDGSCIRDYINVVDLAKAHVLAVNRMVKGELESNIEYYNIGTGKGMSVLGLVHLFEEATGIKLPYEIVGRREGDIVQVWADPSKANKVLGWKAETSMADTLKSAWAWEQSVHGNVVDSENNTTNK